MKQAVILSGYIDDFEKNFETYRKLLKESDIFLHTFDKMCETDVSPNVFEEDIRSSFVKKGIPFENIKFLCIEHELSKKAIVRQLLHRFQTRGVDFPKNQNFLYEHMKHWSALQDFFEKKKCEYNTVYLFNTNSNIDNFLNSTANFFTDKNEHMYVQGKESILKKLKEIYMWSFYRYEMEYYGEYNGKTFMNFFHKLYFHEENIQTLCE